MNGRGTRLLRSFFLIFALVIMAATSCTKHATSRSLPIVSWICTTLTQIWPRR